MTSGRSIVTPGSFSASDASASRPDNHTPVSFSLRYVMTLENVSNWDNASLNASRSRV